MSNDRTVTYVVVWFIRVLRCQGIRLEHCWTTAGREERSGRRERDTKAELGVQIGFKAGIRGVLAVLSACKLHPQHKCHDKTLRVYIGHAPLTRTVVNVEFCAAGTSFL